jgi:hypothetical protein
MGQFGEVGSSTGMSVMAAQARAHGILAQTYHYQQMAIIEHDLLWHQHEGHRVAVIGYSLGVGTGGLVSERIALDLLIGLDPSRDGINYRVGAKTKRSILYHNNNWLTHLTGIGGAGEKQDPGGDLGFQIKREVDENHLLVDLDPSIYAQVLEELLRLANPANQ